MERSSNVYWSAWLCCLLERAPRFRLHRKTRWRRARARARAQQIRIGGTVDAVSPGQGRDIDRRCRFLALRASGAALEAWAALASAL